MTSSRVDRLSTVLVQIVTLAMCLAIMVVSAGCASTASHERLPATESKAKAADPSRGLTLARSFEDAVARGDAAWNGGQADMAIYLYIQALSFKPRDVVTLGKLGSIEQAQGDLALAARAFELAANAAPTDPRLSGRLGLILMTLGDQQTAWKWLKLSVGSGNTDWRVLDQLSVIETKEGHYIDAVQYAAEAVALAPGVALPVLHRGQALYGMKEYVQAEDAARDAIRLGGTSDAWRLLGEIQAKRRAYSSAIDCLLQVMDSAAAYNMAGKLAMDNGDNAIALGYFEKASVASPVYTTDIQHNAAIARERLTSTAKQ